MSTRAVTAARWAWLLLPLLGCSTPSDEETSAGAHSAVSAAVATTAAASPSCTPGQATSATGGCVDLPPIGALPPARCEDPIAVFDAGERVGEVCTESLKELGLTVIQLGETW